ncbi:DUF4957 domain-containing protein [Sphingobacterium haloxyli]|uniref:Fibronectin type-III domain-containing protein n=1 Tax=Sphingobacterium haloxyli TaxID=2100533 RepID=A0A2S9J951_9SPHI|nr:DUF4957 domain-containing protein [Sphingobacterium haloxyli]PRD49290.1 hypothetical protein C5745_01305 [Sphingobacterium haloxyli]
MRYKNFTGSVFSYGRMLFLFLLVAVMYACNKDVAPGPPTSLTQMGSAITLVHADTSLVLQWEAGHAAWEGDSRRAEVSYEVQVSSDSTFNDAAQNVFDFVTDSTSLFLSDQELTPLEPYFARVRTVPSTGTGSSSWMRTSRFQVRPIELFTPIKVWNLSHEAVVLNFGRHGELTKMVVEKADGSDSQEFNVSNDELITMQLEGLTSNTDYVARLFRHDDRSLGELTFTTKPTVEEAGYIDLRGSSDPKILQNTLTTVPDGSVIALKRGMTYTMEGFTLDRGVTLVSEPGFGPQARIEMSSSFNVEGAMDLIKFEDVHFTGDIGGSYVFNISRVATINKIEFEACRMSELRGVMRLQSEGQKSVNEYVINNSIVQNIGNYNALTIDHSDASVRDVRFTNSTFINLQYIIRHGGSVDASLNSVLIENTTLYHSPSDNRHIIDASRGEISNLTVRNTLIGYTSGGRSFNRVMPNSITVSNSFATSDITWGSNTQQRMIEGVIAYGRTSEQVFANPDKSNYANSDLTIMDEALFTVGDPRWRP